MAERDLDAVQEIWNDITCRTGQFARRCTAAFERLASRDRALSDLAEVAEIPEHRPQGKMVDEALHGI